MVIPCLNEANSLEFCVKKVMTAFSKAGMRNEAIVPGNGSTDDSIESAEINGARVVRVAERGHGVALNEVNLMRRPGASELDCFRHVGRGRKRAKDPSRHKFHYQFER